MSSSSNHRNYIDVPALVPGATEPLQPPPSGDDAHNTLGAFRASLLYIAADLRRLIAEAPPERREEVSALSALLTSIAR